MTDQWELLIFGRGYFNLYTADHWKLNIDISAFLQDQGKLQPGQGDEANHAFVTYLLAEGWEPFAVVENNTYFRRKLGPFNSTKAPKWSV